MKLLGWRQRQKERKKWKIIIIIHKKLSEKDFQFYVFLYVAFCLFFYSWLLLAFHPFLLFSIFTVCFLFWCFIVENVCFLFFQKRCHLIQLVLLSFNVVVVVDYSPKQQQQHPNKTELLEIHTKCHSFFYCCYLANPNTMIV